MNFATLHFDTYKVVTLLKERGFTKKQAEGIMEAVQEVTISGIATKEDLHKVETALRSEITKVEANLRSEMHDMETRLSDKLSGSLKFQIIQTITIVGVMVALFSLTLMA